jgi:hypothetical protein
LTQLTCKIINKFKSPFCLGLSVTCNFSFHGLAPPWVEVVLSRRHAFQDQSSGWTMSCRVRLIRPELGDCNACRNNGRTYEWRGETRVTYLHACGVTIKK